MHFFLPNVAKLLKTDLMKLTDDIFDQILIRLSDGEILADILRSTGVNVSTFYNYIRKDPKRNDAYKTAREVSTHALADKLVSVITDESLTDFQKRLYSDNVKWLTARRNKKDYGEKIEIEQNTSIDLKLALKQAESRVVNTVNIAEKYQKQDFLKDAEKSPMISDRYEDNFECSTDQKSVEQLITPNVNESE